MGRPVSRSVLCAAMLVGASATAFAQKPPTTWDPAASCNYTNSTLGRGIQYVVIHTIEGSAAGARSWFKNCAANASAHYVVSYGGSIWQMVGDDDIAWHAGNWYYNTHSIGIEHEGYAGSNNWTTAEYTQSAALTRWICLTYGIPMNRTRIIGHNEVPDPDGTGYGGSGNHWDPGSYFNWTYYMSLVTGGSSSGGGSSGGGSTSVLQAKQVTASSLNVRTGPGTSYSIMGGVSSGQRYVAIAQQSGWYKIYYANNTGWCHGGYLSTVTGVTMVTINTSSLNVRAGPGTSYSIVGTCSSPQKYVRNSTSGDWFRIHYGGAARWVHGGYTTTSGL